MRGELQLDTRRSDAPGVHLTLNAQDLDLAKLAAVAGVKRDIRSGKVRATVDVNGRGTTPHRVASSMSGTILVVSGPASLGRSTTQGESALAQLAGALDPLQSVDAATELRCAVLRLPLSDGIARIDRSIAAETGKIAASASGTLNFRDETLDLSVQPQIRQGVKIDVSQFASLVRIRGPLRQAGGRDRCGAVGPDDRQARHARGKWWRARSARPCADRAKRGNFGAMRGGHERQGAATRISRAQDDAATRARSRFAERRRQGARQPARALVH